MCSEGRPAPSPLAFTRRVQGRRVPQGTKPGRSSEKSHCLGPGGHSRSVRTAVAGHATSELCFEGRVNHAKPEQGKRRLKYGSMQAELRPDARSRGGLGSAQAPRTGPEPHSSPGPSRVVDAGDHWFRRETRDQGRGQSLSVGAASPGPRPPATLLSGLQRGGRWARPPPEQVQLTETPDRGRALQHDTGWTCPCAHGQRELCVRACVCA